MQKGWARFVRAQPFASSTIRLLGTRRDARGADTREKVTGDLLDPLHTSHGALILREILSCFTTGSQRHTNVVRSIVR